MIAAWLLSVELAFAGPLTGLSGPLDASGTPADRVVPDPIPADAPYKPSVYRAAAALNLSRPFVAGVAQGLELLYERRYDACEAYLTELQADFPGTAVAPVGELLVWQAKMLENFDYAHDAAYLEASARAREALAAAAATPGREPWEAVLSAVVVGIEAIHAARQGRYFPALTQAFVAIDHVATAQRLAPDFTDMKLAEGLYNYWRSALTSRIKALPSFGDSRETGLDQMREVVRAGVFLAAPARLSLAFSWFEEKRYTDARDELAINHSRYPGNVINAQLLGLSFLYLKQPKSALELFDHVLRTDPAARRVHYYRGRALMLANRWDEAGDAFTTYVGFPVMEPYQRAAAQYQLGQVRAKQGRYDDAEVAWRAAVDTDGHRGAKERLDWLRKARKAGEIGG